MRSKTSGVDKAITIQLIADEETISRFGIVTNRFFCESIQKEFLPIETVIKEFTVRDTDMVQLCYKHECDVPKKDSE